MASPAKIVPRSDGLTVDYPHEKVTADLSGFRDGRGGELSCVLTVTCRDPGSPTRLLHGVRWNLHALASRTSLMKTLAAQHDQVDWPFVVETTARAALDWHQRGEPLQFLGVEDAIPARTYLIDPYIMRDDVNSLFASAGVGKGWLALGALLSVQERRPILPGLVVGADPVRGLWLDFEWSPEETSRRVRAICPGAMLAYRRCSGLLADQMEQIRTVQRDAAPNGEHTLIVVDSVGMACGTDAGADPAAAYLRMAQAMRTVRHATWLLIDHVAKASEQGKESPYGSAYKMAVARNLWMVRKAQGATKNVLHLGSFMHPASNVPPRHPVGFRVEFEEDGDLLRRVTFCKEDTRDVEGFSDLQSDWQKLEHALRGGPQTAKALADTLGKSETTVRARLNEKRGKKTSHLPDGTWTLLDTRHQEQGRP